MEKDPSTETLTAEQGAVLILLARKTILEKLNKSVEDECFKMLESRLSDKVFQMQCGVFVTLKADHHLRGCIGNLTSGDSIVEGVKTNAVNAAFHDPRFPSLSADEVDNVLIEVSVLSKPEELVFTDSSDLVRKVRVGVDGLILKKGYSSATFLPQVWEQLQTPEEFLSHLSMKAGLDQDEWKNTKVEVYTYQVQYFEENINV